jgi:putative FmdB family regulatory protein
MPTYTYRCRDCGKMFDKTMNIKEHERKQKPSCPKCQGHHVQQVPSSFQAVTSTKT